LIERAHASAEKIEVSGGSLCLIASCSSGKYVATPTEESSSFLEPSVYAEVPWPIRREENSLNFSQILART